MPVYTSNHLHALVLLSSPDTFASIIPTPIMGKVEQFNCTFHAPKTQETYSLLEPNAGIPPIVIEPSYIDLSLQIYPTEDQSSLFPHPTITPTMRSLALAILQGDHLAALAAADLVQEQYLAQP